ADVRDLGKRAVAAVVTVEERHLGHLLERVHGLPNRSWCLLDATVEGTRRRKERCLAREERGVQAPAEAVLERYSEVGLPPSLRLEISGVHLVGREPGVRVRLEEVELVVEGELDFPRKPAPVPRAERSRPVEDLAERCRRHVTAEIDAVEAEAACNRDVPRSE